MTNITNNSLVTLEMYGRYLTIDIFGCVILAPKDSENYWETQVFKINKAPVDKQNLSSITKSSPIVLSLNDGYFGINPISSCVYFKYFANVINTLESDEVFRIVSPTNEQHIKSGDKVGFRNRNGVFINANKYTSFVEARLVGAKDSKENILFKIVKVA